MLNEKINVVAGNVIGLLYGIDYDRQMAIVEMDYSYLVEYPYSEVIVKVK
jgi:hypothetical protein